MFENSPSDRMQFVGMGELTHPGACMVCGSGVREEGYVRLGVYYDFEGEMYLCHTCVVQAGEVIGMLTKPEVEQFTKGIDAYVEALASTQAELDKANERLANYDGIFRDQFAESFRSDPVPSDYGSEAGGQEVRPADEDATVGEISESEPVESVKESGREDSREFTEVDFDGSNPGSATISL